VALDSAESERRFDVLHELYAPRVEALALEMRGFYVKGAQLVSTRDDILPPAHLRWCKRMQAEVPTPFPPDEARRVVEAAMGGPEAFASTFSEWSSEPIGAASIGVVHRARLAADGREVAVKVMAPGIEQKFRSDIGTVKTFCQLAMPQHVSALDEIEKQFFTEFGARRALRDAAPSQPHETADVCRQRSHIRAARRCARRADYVLEAENMALIHDNLMKTHWARSVCVPRPHMALCSQHVLVMDLLPGVKLDDGLRQQWERLARSRGVSLADLEAAEKAKPARGLDERDWGRALALGAIRAADWAANARRFAYNWSAGLALGAVPYTWTELPVELASILRLLAEVHAHEIFVDGVFNGLRHAPWTHAAPARTLTARASMHAVSRACASLAGDPHPGNVLLMPCGRLGLIDYGQVKHIPLDFRLKYAKLIVALADGLNDEARRVATEELGLRTRYGKPEVLWRLLAFQHDRDTADVTEGRNLQLFMEVWLCGLPQHSASCTRADPALVHPPALPNHRLGRICCVPLLTLPHAISGLRRRTRWCTCRQTWSSPGA
jgi:aarF domain-containing kinase